jgi:hypothetical protein
MRIEIEDIFVKGANIYMKKPDFDTLKKVLTKLLRSIGSTILQD